MKVNKCPLVIEIYPPTKSKEALNLLDIYDKALETAEHAFNKAYLTLEKKYDKDRDLIEKAIYPIEAAFDKATLKLENIQNKAEKQAKKAYEIALNKLGKGK